MGRILTDAEAVFLTDAYEKLDAGRQEWAGAELKRWQSARDAKRSETFRRLESRLLDPPDVFRSSLPPAERQHEEAMAKVTGLDRDIRSDNRAFMRAYGIRPESYEAGVVMVGRDVLGIEGEISDQTFHDAARARAATARERRRLAGEWAMAGAEAARTGKAIGDALAERYAAAGAKPVTLPDISYYVGAFQSAYAESRELAAPYEDTIDRVARALWAGQREEDGDVERADLAGWARELAAALYVGKDGDEIDPAVRHEVLSSIAARGFAFRQDAEAAGDDKRGRAGKLGESFVRVGDRPLAVGEHMYSAGAGSVAAALDALGLEDTETYEAADALSMVGRLRADLQDIRDGTVDPLRSKTNNWIENAVYATPDTFAYSAATLHPVGRVVALGSIASSNAAEVRADAPYLEPWKATAVGLVSGTAEVLVDRVQAEGLVRHFPTLVKGLKGVRRQGGLRGLAAYTGAIGAAELAAETGQGMLLPLVEQVGHWIDEDIPNPVLREELARVTSPQQLVETLVALLPLVAASGGRLAARDRSARREALAIDAPGYLEGIGFTTEQAAAVRAESDPVVKLDLYAQARKGHTVTVKPSAAALPERLAAPERGISRDVATGGWNVETESGPATVATYGEAKAIRELAAEQRLDSYDRTVYELAAEYDKVAPEGAHKIALEERARRLEDDVAEGFVAEDEAHEAARVVAETAGFPLESDPLASTIIGRNAGELKGKVYDSQIRMSQGATALDVVGERAQDDSARMMATGLVPKEKQVELLRGWEERHGDKVLHGESDLAVKEAWGQMAKAMAVVRSRGAEPVKGFRDALARVAWGYRTLFRQVMGRAAKLRKALREGSADGDLVELLDQSIGFDDIAAVKAGRVEAKEALPEIELPKGGGSYAMAPADYREMIGAAIDAKANAPEARAKAWAKARDKIRDTLEEFQRIAERLATTRQSVRERAEGYRRRAEAKATEERADELRGLEIPDELTKVTGGPLASFLTENVGKMRSRGAQAKRDAETGANNLGEYDGMPSMPSQMMGGNVTPDEAAQAAYEAGLINEPYADALWEALGAEFESARNNRELARQSRRVLKEIRDNAKAEAGKFYADKVAELEKTRPSDIRQAAVKAVSMLDTLAGAMPKEIRYAAGKFAPLARFTSNEARAEEIVKRAQRLDDALEVYLKEYFREKIADLLESAKPKQKGGKGVKFGKGVPATEVRRAVLRYMKMSPEKYAEVRAEADAAAEGLAGDALEKHVEAVRLMHAFANYAERDAADLENAYAVLRQHLGVHAVNWQILQQSQTDAVEAAIDGILDAIGEADMNKARLGEDRRARTLGLAQLDPGQWFDVVFDGNAYAKGIIRRIRLQLQGHESKSLDHRRALLDFVKARTGLAGDREATNWLVEQLKLEVVEEATPMYSGDADKQKLDLYDARRVAADPAVADEMGFSPAEAEVVKAALESRLARWERENQVRKELGKKKKPQPRVVEVDFGTLRDVVTHPRTKGELLNELLFLEQPGYAENQEKRGYPPGAQQVMREAVGDDVYAVGAFMRDRLAKMHGRIDEVVGRMTGAPMPRLFNYWPGNIDGVGERDSPFDDIFTPSGTMVSRYPGATIERVAHNRPPRITDAVDVYFAHLAQMEYFVHMAEVGKEMRQVFGSDRVRKAVQAKVGKDSLSQLDSWVELVEKGGVLDAKSKLFDARAFRVIYDKFVKVALGMKLGTIMVQATNYFQTIAGLRRGEFSRAWWRLQTDRARMREARAAVEATGYLEHRRRVGVSPEIRGITSSKPKKTGRLDYLATRSTDIISMADTHYLGKSGAIAYEALRHRYAQTMSEEAAARRAGKELRHLLEEVAQPVNFMNRSLTESSGGAAYKLFFLAFISDQRRKVSFIVRNALAGDRIEAARMVANFHIRFGVAEWVLRGAASWLAGGDEPEEAWAPDKLAAAVLTGPWSGVPIFGRIGENMIRGGLGLFTFSNDPIYRLYQAINLRAYARYVEKLGEGDILDDLNATADLMQRVGPLASAALGVGGNVVEQATNLARRVTGETGAGD